MLWLYLALFASFLAGFADITIKNMTKSKSDTLDICIISFILIGVLCIPILFYRMSIDKFKMSYISKKDSLNLIIYSLLYIILSVAYFYSSKYASNPGYTRLFYNTNVIITFFLASLFLDSNINFKTIMGVVITIIGLSIVVLSKNL